MATPTLKELLEDPAMKVHFIEDTGISKARLMRLLKADDEGSLIYELREDFTVFSYSTENGDCEVIDWRGHYFSKSEWDPLTGPYPTLDEALEPIRYLLQCGDQCDTDSGSHTVYSMWPNKQTLEIIQSLVSVGDVVQVNGVKYRRADSGYVKE